MADKNYLSYLRKAGAGESTFVDLEGDAEESDSVLEIAPEMRSRPSEKARIVTESSHSNVAILSAQPELKSDSGKISRAGTEGSKKKEKKAKNPGEKKPGLFQRLTGSKNAVSSVPVPENDANRKPARRPDPTGAAIHAIERGALDELRRLVPANVPADAVSARGRSLLSIALHHRQQKIADYLLLQFRGRVIKAIEDGDIGQVRAFVPIPVGADTLSGNGRSLLKIAAFHRRSEIETYLTSCMDAKDKLPAHSSMPTRIELPSAISGRVIEFYDKNAPFYEFTNFHIGNPIDIDGKLWKTTEHYFQAQKFLGDVIVLQDEVRELPTPREVFDFARANDGKKRNDWDSVKDDVMRKALRAKFNQDAALKALLLQTGNARLIENSPNDSYWGCGRNGDGRNRLGELLMELRGELRRESEED